MINLLIDAFVSDLLLRILGRNVPDHNFNCFVLRIHIYSPFIKYRCDSAINPLCSSYHVKFWSSTFMFMLYVNAKYEGLFNRLWKHQETLNSFSITSPNLIAVMGQPCTLPQPTGDCNHTIFQLFNRKYSGPFIVLLGLPDVFLSIQV